MAVSQEMKDWVACPKCRGPLELVTDAAQAEMGFACRACALLYAIEDDIPNFLVPEAKPLAAS